jgi:hypothetical protein
MIWLAAGLLWTALNLGILLMGIMTNSAAVTLVACIILGAFSILSPLTIAWLWMRSREPQHVSDTALQTLDSIRRYRHDWMNRLQVLFAYIKLQKFDLMDASVQSMMMRSEQEQSMAQIGVPELSLFFLTDSEWGRAGIEVDLQCERMTTNERLPVDGSAVTAFVKSAMFTETQRGEKIFVSVRETEEGLHVTVRSAVAGTQTFSSMFQYDV